MGARVLTRAIFLVALLPVVMLALALCIRFAYGHPATERELAVSASVVALCSLIWFRFAHNAPGGFAALLGTATGAFAIGVHEWGRGNRTPWFALVGSTLFVALPAASLGVALALAWRAWRRQLDHATGNVDIAEYVCRRAVLGLPTCAAALIGSAAYAPEARTWPAAGLVLLIALGWIGGTLRVRRLRWVRRVARDDVPGWRVRRAERGLTVVPAPPRFVTLNRIRVDATPAMMLEQLRLGPDTYRRGGWVVVADVSGLIVENP